MITDRPCAWCRGAIPATARRDARTCSKRCRQALHRFARGCRAAADAALPRRWAVADPPYPDLADYYIGHPDYAGEVDHVALVSRLQEYDGWALCTSSDALPRVLQICDGLPVRVASWVRGHRPTRTRRPQKSWEPVIYCGAREVDPPDTRPPRLDSLVYTARARTTDPRRVIGAKPAEFAWWLFDLLGAAPNDTLDDLFPGSGGIGRAWSIFQTSSEDLRDASARAARDASRSPAVDTSAPAPCDMSPRSQDDASAEYSRDSSRGAA